MKKILVISIGYPHPSKGASSVVFYWYLFALRLSNYDVTHLLLVPPDEVSGQDADEYLQAIKPCTHFHVCIAVTPGVRYTTLSGLDLRAANLIEEALACVWEAQPEATLCFDIYAAMIARQAGLPNLLVWLRDLAFQTSLYHSLYDIKSNLWKLSGLAKSMASAWLWKRCYRSVLRHE